MEKQFSIEEYLTKLKTELINSIRLLETDVHRRFDEIKLLTTTLEAQNQKLTQDLKEKEESNEQIQRKVPKKEK